MLISVFFLAGWKFCSLVSVSSQDLGLCSGCVLPISLNYLSGMFVVKCQLVLVAGIME